MSELVQDEIALDLFYEMLRIRLVEEAIADRYPEQKMRCPVHLSIGQEAVAVGVCSALLQSDYLLSTHRAHAHYLAKGGDLQKMIAEIYGKSTGCSLGRGGSMHLVDLSVGMLGSTPIVGGSLPVAVGTAFGSYLKKDPHLTVVFFGEGSTEEGVFAESLNFAVLKKLPVLFICENNFYSVYSPLEVRQPATRDRIAFCKAHGCPAVLGDGNDIEDVVHKAQEAVKLLRQGEGPFYLEFTTYRHREHCGPSFDNTIGYRTEEEFEFWKTKCPIENYREVLLERNLLPEERVIADIKQEILDAFAFAENSPFPTPESDARYS